MRSPIVKLLISGLVLAVVMAVFITSRSLSAQDATTTPSTPQVNTTQVVGMEGNRSSDGVGYVRVVHASPDVAAINLSLSGQEVTTGLGFGENTDFVEFPAGTYTVEVTTSAGSDILSKPMVLAPGTSATLVLTGKTSGGSQTALDLGMFLTERDATRGKARLDVINAVPDVPAMDLVTTQPLLTSIAFGKVSDAVLKLDPGSYDFKLVSSDSQATVLNLSDTQLEADTIYTIVALGQQSTADIKPVVLITKPLMSQPTATATAASGSVATATATGTTTATTTIMPTVTGTTTATSEATVETTVEATSEVTPEATAAPTSEATSEVTAAPSATPTLEATAEVTVSP